MAEQPVTNESEFIEFLNEEIMAGGGDQAIMARLLKAQTPAVKNSLYAENGKVDNRRLITLQMEAFAILITSLVTSHREHLVPGATQSSLLTFLLGHLERTCLKLLALRLGGDRDPAAPRARMDQDLHFEAISQAHDWTLGDDPAKAMFGRLYKAAYETIIEDFFNTSKAEGDYLPALDGLVNFVSCVLCGIAGNACRASTVPPQQLVDEMMESLRTAVDLHLPEMLEEFERQAGERETA